MLSREIARIARRNRPGEYAGFVASPFLVLNAMPVNDAFLAAQIVASCMVVAGSTGRLFDAGVSRYWACLVLPTLASPWLFPLLIPGARPYAILLQTVDGIALRNPYQIALAVTLFIFPLWLAFAPTRRPKEEGGEPPDPKAPAA